jgi:hypothetical protein
MLPIDCEEVTDMIDISCAPSSESVPAEHLSLTKNPTEQKPQYLCPPAIILDGERLYDPIWDMYCDEFEDAEI